MEIVPIYLILSMFITLLVLYMMYPEPKVVYAKPDLNDNVSRTYKDNNNVCYRYHKKETSCPLKK